jgi:hypothetical protein
LSGKEDLEEWKRTWKMDIKKLCERFTADMNNGDAGTAELKSLLLKDFDE